METSRQVRLPQANFLFGLFAILHVACWTLVPTIIRGNLPMDAIEGTIWGHQLQWGYDKDPFLNGWLTALATYIANADWPLYLFSQLSVLACLISIWCIAKRILNPAQALVSILLLEMVQYFNFHAIDFNDNTVELGLWGIISYCFYVALRSPSLSIWFLLGCLAGLGMMAKYYTLALLAGMGLLLIINKDYRKLFGTLKPYVALLGFLIIITPHVVWLFHHDFISVRYVLGRAGMEHYDWYYHLTFPTVYIGQQLQVFLPAILIYAIFFFRKKSANNPTIAETDKQFLFCVGLAPILLTSLLSLIFAIKLRAGWGMPLLSLWGVILLAMFKPNISLSKLKLFFGTIITFMLLFVGGYSLALRHAEDSSANFPGKELAQLISTQWHNQFHTRLPYVGGSRWLGGNIGFYADDKPSVYVDWDHSRSPWINVKDLNKKGGVFVWNVSNRESLPDAVKTAFPRLKETLVYELPWRGNPKVPPVKIAVAMLPPASAS